MDLQITYISTSIRRSMGTFHEEQSVSALTVGKEHTFRIGICAIERGRFELENY